MGLKIQVVISIFFQMEDGHNPTVDFQTNVMYPKLRVRNTIVYYYIIYFFLKIDIIYIKYIQIF